MNDSINEMRHGGDDEYDGIPPEGRGASGPVEPKVLWSMTFSTMDNGQRDLHVEGSPSIAEMMAELQTMIENLRAQLFVDKLMAQGKAQQGRIIRPGQ